MLLQFIVRIIAVLADQDGTINSEFVPTKCQCLTNALIDRDVVRFGKFASDVPWVSLIQIDRNQIDARLLKPLVGRKSLHILCGDYVCVRKRKVCSDDSCYLLAFRHCGAPLLFKSEILDLGE